MTETALLPCPLCGVALVTTYSEVSETRYVLSGYAHTPSDVANNCPLRWWTLRLRDVAAWNRRALSPPAGAREVGAPADEAVLALSKALFWKMEHLDPTTDFDHARSLDENWEALEDPIKSIFRQSILWILAHSDLVRAALSPPAGGDGDKDKDAARRVAVDLLEGYPADSNIALVCRALLSAGGDGVREAAQRIVDFDPRAEDWNDDLCDDAVTVARALLSPTGKHDE